MSHKIRKHLTPSTAIAFIALIFALTGGAFAASSHGGGASGTRATASTTLATSAKAKPKTKAGPRGPAGPAGKNGAAGPAGPAGPTGPGGPQGPQGNASTNGTNGTDGTDGTNGHEGKQGIQGIQGVQGEPWTAGGTLPAGKTETGTWGFSTAHVVDGLAPISFTIPLPEKKGAASKGEALEESQVHYLKFEETLTGKCEGTVEAPSAAPGNLCVYERESEGLNPNPAGTSIFVPGKNANVGPPGQGASVSGAMVYMLLEAGTEPAHAYGSWAVTAPAA
jgi:hypothetical protein